MKLTVFGANGRIGRLVVQQALDAGDEVVPSCVPSTTENTRISRWSACPG